MKPRYRQGAQVAGAAALAVTSLIFALRGAPFLWGKPNEERWMALTAEVTEKGKNSVDGRAEARFARHELRVLAAVPGTGERRGSGQVDADEFAAVGPGDSVPVYWTGRRLVLRDDVRWQPKHRRQYWLMLAVAAVLGVETVRRIVLWNRAKTPPPPSNRRGG
jgi:hypothetical protein